MIFSLGYGKKYPTGWSLRLKFSTQIKYSLHES